VIQARFSGSILRREFVLLYSASEGIVMKPLLFALCVAFAFGGLSAQTPSWQPSPGHTQVEIWPGKAPDAKPLAGPEDATTVNELVAGKPWVSVGKVSRPTMTVYFPEGKNTGAAVVVFPGGGYWVLAIDLEGTEVCDWLTSKGITCVLLKYRVPGDGLEPKSGAYPRSPMALEDAPVPTRRRAYRLRFNNGASARYRSSLHSKRHRRGYALSFMRSKFGRVRISQQLMDLVPS
jgi:acetyl esterase/lipase